MKYLKSFNIQDDLMYLKDNGFDINLISCTENNTPINLQNQIKSLGKFSDFSNLKISKEQKFNWIDIKYDFIPFLELISKKYNIIYCSYDIGLTPLSRSVISIYDIIDDRIKDLTEMTCIQLIMTDGITPEKSQISTRKRKQINLP